MIHVDGSPIRLKKCVVLKISGWGALDLKAYRSRRGERALNSVISIITSCFLRRRRQTQLVRGSQSQTYFVFPFSISFFPISLPLPPTPFRFRSLNPLLSSSLPGSSRVGKGPGNEVESRVCYNVTSTLRRFSVQRF